MLSAFRCRDTFFFHIENQATVVGTLLSLMIHDTADDATMTHLFQSKWKHHRNEEFRNNSVRERGWENWDILWYLVPYGIWYYRNTKCKSSVYLIHTTISTEQQMLMKTVQFVICFVCKFLAFWLLRNKKCMIFTSNYVLA